MFDRRNAMSRPALNEKQEKVYRYLVSSIAQGFPPTVREICAALNIKSTSTVHGILDVLEDGGYNKGQLLLPRNKNS